MRSARHFFRFGKCLALCSCLVLAFFCGGTPAQAGLSQEQAISQSDVAFKEAMEKGKAAFRRGKLGEAEAAFQEAYLIRPFDSELTSWLSLVRDEQKRRQAMTDTLKDVENYPPVYPISPMEELEARAQVDKIREKEAKEGLSSPLQERLGLSEFAPWGIDRLVTPVEEGRPEILEKTKRAGYQALYKEGIGLQPIPGLGFSSRVEIFDEPNPVDDFVLEAKIQNFSALSDFRRSILPLFTRAYAFRTVADYEPWPRLTYEFDKRHILHELQTRFGVKDRNLETHAFNALYTFPRLAVLGLVTLNPWYKRVFQESDDDNNSFEDKDEFVFNLSVQPSDNLEYFFQYNTFESVKTKSIGASKLQLFKGQIRARFPKLKLFMIPSFEYSRTTFDPSDDVLIKKDFFVDWGFDVTKHLRASSKEQIVFLTQIQPASIPSHPKAQTYSTKNTLSYELFKDFDVSFGLDYTRAAGMNVYNNVGLRAEMQLFKPGIIRSSIGYEWVSYYNISDDLSLIFWKLFLFQ